MSEVSGKPKQEWVLDKNVTLATGINLVQLIAFVWFGATFYAQTNERFNSIAEQRKTSADQMVQLQSAQNQLQTSQNQLLQQITVMGADVKYLGRGMEDIKDTLKKH